MRQYDVYHPANGQGPLILVLQADTVEGFNVVVAAPLYPAADWEKPTRHLQPTFHIDGEIFVLATNHLAAIPRSQLGSHVASLEIHRTDIIAALDFLFTGI